MFFLLSYGELFVNVNMSNVNVSTTVRKPYFLRKPLRVFNVSPYVQKYVNVNAA